MKHQTSDISVSDIGLGKSDIGRQTSDIRILLFLSDSFDVETINTFILTSVVSSKPYPISDQKDQNLCPLSDRNGVAQRPHPLGRHIPIWFIEGSAPPGGGFFDMGVWASVCSCRFDCTFLTSDVISR